jgi:ABC-type glycerol-3-phosphate transport system substrate-binding protein
MKKFVKMMAAIALACAIAGCGGTITVVRPEGVVTNTASMKAFQDESYVWETWQYGTNKADNVVK